MNSIVSVHNFCVFFHVWKNKKACMATPDFPQERLVHDAFGYVGFLLAEVRLNAR